VAGFDLAGQPHDQGRADAAFEQAALEAPQTGGAVEKFGIGPTDVEMALAAALMGRPVVAGEND